MTEYHGHPSVAATCMGKVRFASAALAHAVCRRGKRTGRLREMYRCAYCHGWHLGRPMPDKNIEKRRATRLAVAAGWGEDDD